MNYRCTIENNEGKQIANIYFTISSDEAVPKMNKMARNLMEEFLKLIAVNNFIQPKDCNTNLYREEWINGI